jgi:BatD DUF11 like domain
MHLLTKTGKSLYAGLVAFVFLLTAFAAQADVNVTASVDRNSLDPDDTFTYTVSVSASDDVSVSQPTLPPINDFEILNEWQSQEARSTFVTTPSGPKFQTVRSTNYNFMLQPKREGTLSISASEVVVEGKTYLTKPIQIRVGKGLGIQARPRIQQNPSGIQMPPGFEDEEEDDLFTQLLRRGVGQGVDENDPSGGSAGSRTLPINPNDAFFVQVETDKTEAYVGEQITVSFYLYTRGQIRDLDTLKYPSLKGFWKEDIEIATHLNFVSEVVNGLPYKKALLASFALFPIKDGPATIDSYTAKCTVMPAFDNFSGLGFGKAYTYTKSSQPIKVNVKPLPTEGRPADFSGAVGDFQVTARVEDKDVVSNQPFTYKVRFEGRGNAKLIEIPPFQPPEGLELYDTQKDSKFFRTGTSFKDFSIMLIPRREGEFTIPGISTSIFDPKEKKYITRMTEPVRILVGVGQGPQAGGTEMKNGGGSGKGGAKADRPPQLLTQYDRPIALTRAQYLVAMPILLLGLVAALIFRARKELGWGQKKKDLHRRLRARLRRVETRANKGDWRGVGVEMTNALYFVLGEISGEGGANMELEKLLAKAPPSVRRELAGPIAKQMDVFQVLSFAPENVVGDLKNPDKLKASVAEMTKLMEKAINLGSVAGLEESSEQSDGSGLNPKAF